MQPIPIHEFYPRVSTSYYSSQSEISAQRERTKTLQQADMNAVFGAVPPIEAHVVLDLVRKGKVDGGTFGDDKDEPCACLLGSIARHQGVDSNTVIRKIDDFGLGEAFDAQDYFRPVFPGDRPTNSTRASAIYHDILELMLSNPKAFRTSREKVLAKRYHRSTQVSERD